MILKQLLENDVEIGLITKKYGGFIKEMASNATSFNINCQLI